MMIVCLILFKAVDPCVGQTMTQRTEPFSEQLVVPPAPANIVEQQDSTVLASGFWIVSSHQMPQSFNDLNGGFCPGVLRYDEGIGYRQSSLSELCQ